MAAVGYWVLARSLVAAEGEKSLLHKAVGKDYKGAISVLVYAVAIPLAFVRPWISQLIFVAVALAWLVPDRRIERLM